MIRYLLECSLGGHAVWVQCSSGEQLTVTTNAYYALMFLSVKDANDFVSDRARDCRLLWSCEVTEHGFDVDAPSTGTDSLDTTGPTVLGLMNKE